LLDLYNFGQFAVAEAVARCRRQLCAGREGIDPWGEYWRFTAQSTRHLFGALFPADNLQIVTYGNVLSAAASLYGLAAADLTMQELDYCDANFEVIIAVRAQKPIADARAVVSDRHE
jgi:hypothetical protein